MKERWRWEEGESCKRKEGEGGRVMKRHPALSPVARMYGL